MRKRFPSALPSLALLLCLPLRGAGGLLLSGRVVDPTGAPVPRAEVQLVTSQQAVVATTRTDNAGTFRFAGLLPGGYILMASAASFAPGRKAVEASGPQASPVILQLELRPLRETVTVTAQTGSAADVAAIPQAVNIIGEEDLRERARSVLAQVAGEEAGLHLQRTSPTIAGIYVRGLTGNKVNVFVDGVRYSTSAARGGINTFLNLIESSSLQSVEVLRGPNSSQYGSDAIGGSLQFLSRIPRLSHGDRPEWSGSVESAFNSADAGASSYLTANWGGRNLALLAHLGGARVSTLRPGGGFDSHAAATRFLGLRSDAVSGSRLPDTAFSRYGGMLRLNWSPSARSQWIAHYGRGQMDGGKRYDQLLGGDGNLVADLRNLMLDLAYFKYNRFRLGPIDQLTVSASYNAQREERVNQGGNGNPRAVIQHDRERTRAQGFQLLARKFWAGRHDMAGGAEYYRERIGAPSFGFDPVQRVFSVRRPRVPDKARYDSGALYLQQSSEAIRGRLHLSAGLRYSVASYRSRAADSPVTTAGRLWPDDSLRASDLSGRAGGTITLAAGFGLFAGVSRGYRAPHMTDLGTFGLTGSGFEIAAPDIAGMGGTIGSTAGADAVTTGRPVLQVEPERSTSWDAGARYQGRNLGAELTFFVNTVLDNITKQALILPPGAVGRTLAGQAVTAQASGGAVYVAPSSAPVLVRSNYGDARIRGLEHSLDWSVLPTVRIGTRFTWLVARDLESGLPPAIEGGTPASDAWFRIRFAPKSERFWLQPYLHAAGRQERLSSLDLEDRRTGAMRTRSSIRSFFLNGATARGWIAAGPDGIFGTADDLLIATGETLSQVQDRVLGAGIQRAPLFTAIPGYITLNLRAGWKLAENQDLLLDFSNIGDRNYRGISWGLDAPGRSLTLRYRIAW